MPESVLDAAPAPAAALLAAADAEADAFADRLHDGVLQALVVARYAADAAVRGGDPALARDAVQEALVALRQEVWHLRPRGADDLVAALNELSHHRAAAGAELTLDLDAAGAAALSPALRAAVYRFVQAATTGGSAQVSLRRDGAHVSVEVTASAADLSGWAARAAALGGHLDASGPTSRLLLPLTRNDNEGDR